MSPLKANADTPPPPRDNAGHPSCEEAARPRDNDRKPPPNHSSDETRHDQPATKLTGGADEHRRKPRTHTHAHTHTRAPSDTNATLPGTKPGMRRPHVAPGRAPWGEKRGERYLRALLAEPG